MLHHKLVSPPPCHRLLWRDTTLLIILSYPCLLTTFPSRCLSFPSTSPALYYLFFGSGPLPLIHPSTIFSPFLPPLHNRKHGASPLFFPPRIYYPREEIKINKKKSVLVTYLLRRWPLVYSFLYITNLSKGLFCAFFGPSFLSYFHLRIKSCCLCAATRDIVRNLCEEKFGGIPSLTFPCCFTIGFYHDIPRFWAQKAGPVRWGLATVNKPATTNGFCYSRR